MPGLLAENRITVVEIFCAPSLLYSEHYPMCSTSLFCSTTYTFCDGHQVKLQSLYLGIWEEMWSVSDLQCSSESHKFFCCPQKEKMKIKTQQLVEKVRRSPDDNGSFEVQSKLKEAEGYCWQMIVHFAFIQLFPPYHFKFPVSARKISLGEHLRGR